MKEQKYLVKIEFDCNDADYIYGCGIVDQKVIDFLESHQNLKINLGGDLSQDVMRKISECITYEKINEKEEKVLTKLGLDNFGEFYSFDIMVEEDFYDEDDN